MAAERDEVAQFARRAAAAASVATISKAGAAPMGKTEAVIALAASFGFANVADKMPPEQAIYAWSVAGTVLGAVLGGLHLKQGGWMQRIARFAMCFAGGLILAPFAVAQIPRSASTPEWWHAFAASGIAAFLAWVLVEEAGPWVRDWIKMRRGKR